MKKLLGIAFLVGALLPLGCDKEEATKDEDKKSSSDDDGDDKKSKKKKKDKDDDDGGDKKAGGKKDEPVVATAAAGAAAHLAAGCEVVGRIDVKRILEAAPIKANVVPALEELKNKEPKNDSDKRFKAFLTETGMDPIKDIHEVAFCVTEVKNAAGGKGQPTFSFVLGGNFKQGSILPALEKHHKPDQKLTTIDLAGIKAMTDDKNELYVGQTSDGAILVASAKGPFELAVPTSDAAKTTFQLPADQAIAVVVPEAIVKAAMEQGRDNPFKQHVPNMGRAALTFDVAAAQMQLRMAFKDDKSAIEFGGLVKTVIAEMAKQPAGGGGPEAMALQLLKDAKVDYQGSEMIVKVDLPRDQLDALAKQAAEGIRKEIGSP